MFYEVDLRNQSRWDHVKRATGVRISSPRDPILSVGSLDHLSV